FADLHIRIDDLIEEGDRVAVRWHCTGTLTGSGLGVAPTGKPMQITGMSILRVHDEQIVEAWNNFDVLGMHQQLGTLGAIAALKSSDWSHQRRRCPDGRRGTPPRQPGTLCRAALIRPASA